MIALSTNMLALGIMLYAKRAFLFNVTPSQYTFSLSLQLTAATLSDQFVPILQSFYLLWKEE